MRVKTLNTKASGRVPGSRGSPEKCRRSPLSPPAGGGGAEHVKGNGGQRGLSTPKARRRPRAKPRGAKSRGPRAMRGNLGMASQLLQSVFGEAVNDLL